MFSEIFDIFSMIYYSLLGFGTVLFATIKSLFTGPILPITILGLIGFTLKSITH